MIAAPRTHDRKGATAAIGGLIGVLLALVIGGLGVVPAAHADPAPAAPPDSDGTSDQPLGDFGSCLAGGGKGSIVLLVDQSGSLADTDPDSARVKAGNFLVQQLGDFAKSSGYDVDVRVAGFAADYETPGDWVTLGGDSTPTLQKQISTVGSDLKSHDTDYWTALESARQDIADHGSSCSAIFWFSDGEYDIDPRESSASRSEFGESKPYAPSASLRDEKGASEAVAAGQKDICRAAGVADQLRGSGITVVGIGLTSGKADFSFMKSVTTGGGGTTKGVEKCGDSDSPQGAFYSVDDIDSLFMAFDELSTPGDTVRSEDLDVCQGKECAKGEMKIVLDSSLDSVHVVATSEVEGVTAYVVPPGAKKSVRFPSGSGSKPVESGGMRTTWLSSKTVAIDMKAEDIDSWDGTWRIGFFDPDSSSSDKKITMNVHLSSPLTLQWKDASDAQLRQGQKVDDAELQLVDRTDGHAVDPGSLKSTIRGDVTIKDAGGERHRLLSVDDAKQLGTPQHVTIPADVALGAAELDTSLVLTTAAPEGSGEKGTELDPSRSSAGTEVLAPQNFPNVGSGIDFGRLEKTTTASAGLQVTGPGCVWVDPKGTRLTGVPAEAGTTRVSSDADSADDCISVDKGKTGNLPVTLTAEDHANGAVQGGITVMLAPADDPDAAQPVTVPVRADMRRPLDVGTTWTVFVIALVIGIGIPLAALYAVRWWASRIPRGTLVLGSTRAVVPPAGESAELSLDRADLTMTSLARPQRSVTVAGRTLRARMGVLPTEVPWVELEGGDPAISGASPGTTAKGRARLPLGTRNTWVAVADQGTPHAVTLLVLLGSEDQSALDKVLDDARQRLGDRVRTLAPSAGGAEPTPDTPPADPWSRGDSDAVAGDAGRSADGWGSSSGGADGGFSSDASTDGWGTTDEAGRTWDGRDS